MYKPSNFQSGPLSAIPKSMSNTLFQPSKHTENSKRVDFWVFFEHFARFGRKFSQRGKKYKKSLKKIA